MSFVSELFITIDNHLLTYVNSKVPAVMALVDPLVTTLMGLAFAVYGYLHMRGEIEQPFMAFVDKAIKIGAVSGVALSVGHYNALVVDTIQNAPVALGSVLTGGNGSATLNGDIGTLLDSVLDNLYDVGASFYNQGSVTSPQNYFVGLGVWAVDFIIAGTAAFYVVLAKIGTAVMLALGPIFITSLLSEKTKDFFARWASYLVQLVMIEVLALAVVSLTFSVMLQVSKDLAALGAGAQIVDLGGMVITTIVAIGLLWNVPSWAAGIAGGVSFSTHGHEQKATRLAVGQSFNGMKKVAGLAKSGVSRIRNRQNSISQSGDTSTKEKFQPRKEMRTRRTGTDE